MEELFFVKKERIFINPFKEALWVARHCGEEKAREVEKQLLIHAGTTCF